MQNIKSHTYLKNNLNDAVVVKKSKKEKEPNPDKKPNVTKYTPSAGGKSNIS